MDLEANNEKDFHWTDIKLHEQNGDFLGQPAPAPPSTF
jgi:hypothetical protein